MPGSMSAEALGEQVGECDCFSVAAEMTTNWDRSSIRDPSAKSSSEEGRANLHVLGTETRKEPYPGRGSRVRRGLKVLSIEDLKP